MVSQFVTPYHPDIQSSATSKETGHNLLYLLIENGTTFLLKTIPLIGVKPVALQMQKQHKNNDKYGYQTRNYQTILPGVR
jgi:hypothetical protein